MLVIESTEAQPERRQSIRQLVKDMFLPAGYPLSVSHDYTRYQVYNALQAFCSSLAGLLSARAVLEGFGVGDASASATNAMLLGVLQDICSRLATIFGAYFFGTSLWPEAKTYRLLADVLNDFAITLDVLSPFFNSLNGRPGLPTGIGSVIRISALCVSGCCRALCGVTAGGSKAALTLHFSHGINGTGDVGDLSAKDGSKETVLALLGTLCGTALIPHLSTSQSTYVALAVLLVCHLYANYRAVCGVTLGSLNRQRAALLWQLYTESQSDKVARLDRRMVASHERILCRPDVIYHSTSSRRLARCTILTSPAQLVKHCSLPCKKSDRGATVEDQAVLHLANLFVAEKFMLWFANPCERCLQPPDLLYITMKPDYSARDMLKAWLIAAQCARSFQSIPTPWTTDLRLASVELAHRQVSERFEGFLQVLKDNHWDVASGLVFPGTPAHVSMTIV